MAEVTPYILGFNPSKRRFRVGIRVIEDLGYPKRIRFLIHPEKHYFLVQACDIDEICSFKVSKKRVIESRHGPEFSSAPLLRILGDKVGLRDKESYRIYGEIDLDNKWVLFDLNNYCIVDAADSEEND